MSSLLEGARIGAVETVAEIGCGDGAVLEELGRRGVGREHVGMDISSSAVALAAGRPGIARAERFDGSRVPAGNRAYDLVLATHALEHVPAPDAFVVELARIARRALVIEVPLERNLSARRPAARAASEAAGHLHDFDRAGVRHMVRRSGWRIVAELLDPLPLAVHAFAAETAAARAKARLKWLIRSGLAASPSVVPARSITLHYAVLAIPQ